MDLNPTWTATLWVMHNSVDLAIWGVVLQYVFRAVLTNIPSAKSNDLFMLFCNLLDGAVSAVKGIRTPRNQSVLTGAPASPDDGKKTEGV